MWQPSIKFAQSQLASLPTTQAIPNDSNHDPYNITEYYASEEEYVYLPSNDKNMSWAPLHDLKCDYMMTDGSDAYCVDACSSGMLSFQEQNNLQD